MVCVYVYVCVRVHMSTHLLSCIQAWLEHKPIIAHPLHDTHR